MKVKTTLAAVVGALALTVPATASAMTMHFNIARGMHVTMKKLRQIESANVTYAQVIQRAWGTERLDFHAGRGVPVYVEGQNAMNRDCGQGAAACHGVDYNGNPVIVVGKYDWTWTLGVSHEIAETLADPYVNRVIGPRYVEIADAVEANYFTLPHNPSMLTDFVLPAWFDGTTGPWDIGRVLKGAAPHVAFGGYDPLTGYGKRHPQASSLLARLMP